MIGSVSVKSELEINMMIEIGVRYGRTTKEVRELGYPEDNENNIKVDNEIVLTDDEIREMFLNQFIVLKIVTYKDIYDLFNDRRVIVKYFKCEGRFSVKAMQNLQKEDPGGVYLSDTNYDPALEGDFLWF